MIASDLLNDTVKNILAKIVADNKKSTEELNEKYDALASQNTELLKKIDARDADIEHLTSTVQLNECKYEDLLVKIDACNADLESVKNSDALNKLKIAMLTKDIALLKDDNKKIYETNESQKCEFDIFIKEDMSYKATIANELLISTIYSEKDQIDNCNKKIIVNCCNIFKFNNLKQYITKEDITESILMKFSENYDDIIYYIRCNKNINITDFIDSILFKIKDNINNIYDFKRLNIKNTSFAFQWIMIPIKMMYNSTSKLAHCKETTAIYLSGIKLLKKYNIDIYTEYSFTHKIHNEITSNIIKHLELVNSNIQTMNTYKSYIDNYTVLISQVKDILLN